jgi:Fic family protein
MKQTDEYAVEAPRFIQTLIEQRQKRLKGGVYHLNQIEMAYNSNRIEGSRLTREQTRYIYDTKSVFDHANVDDVIETVNHFRLFDYMLDNLQTPLDDGKIKEYHRILKSGTSDSDLSWFKVGDWKALANEVGETRTSSPENVSSDIGSLLQSFGNNNMTFNDIADFHYRFERIHPFQDGNGRVGRIILFEQCLKNCIMPFIVLDEQKDFYYRGLSKYPAEKGYLLDTLRSFQDAYYKKYQEFIPGL